MSTKLYRNTVQALCLMFCAAFFSSVAHAEMAPAGSFIGNQASMQFTDAEGQRRSVDSNRVDVEVLPVYALSLTVDGQIRRGGANGSVHFPHTLRNRGNGRDSFSFNLANQAGDDYDFQTLQLFYDDGSGNPDLARGEITGDVEVDAGEDVRVIVVAQTPAAATDGQEGQLSITATSVGDGTETATNTDTAIISDNAVLRVSKQFSATSADPSSGPHTVTLTIENLSGIASGAITITDPLDAALQYVTESGNWSEDAGALTDAAAGDPAGVDYSYNAGTATVSVTIDSIAANDTQTISFDVNIASDAGAGPVTNTANYSYDDGAGNNVGPEDSNEAVLEVNQVAGPDVGDQDPDGGNRSDTDEGPAGDNVVEIDSAGQGAIVQFDNIVTNSGNGTDTFDILLSNDTFPVGTTYRLLQSDGSTPLLDNNGDPDGAPDTGVLQAGETYVVVLEVTLPAGVSGDNGGNGWAITKTARSTFDPNVQDSSTDRLNSIAGAAVDLTANRDIAGGANAGDGLGQGPEADPVVSVTAEAGDAAVFNLYVNNTEGSDDNYSLSENDLPSGWTVSYFFDSNGNGELDDGDQPVDGNKTGVIAAGDSRLIFAQVGVPAGTDPGNSSLGFVVNSAETSARDELTAEVVVAATRDIVITPADQSGTVFPGGTEVYAHQITNNGNVDEQLDLAVSNSGAGWTSTVYIDVDGDGTVSPGDIAIDPNNPIDLPAGESVNIVVEVQAPAGGAQGEQNVTTISGSYNGGNSNMAPATDTTTISSGNADISKTQALDADCDGTADGAYVSTNIQAEPGQCVAYEITATAVDADLTDILISDAIPQFSTYFTCGGSCGATVSTGVITNEPANGERGSLRAELATLARGTNMRLNFTVQLDDDR